MVVNFKKMFLFLLVCVLVLSMASAVSAFPAGGAHADKYYANITAICLDVSGTNCLYETVQALDVFEESEKNAFGEVFYLKNRTGDTESYFFNITLFAKNLTAGFNNMSRLNISLPVGMNYTGLSSSNASMLNDTNFTAYLVDGRFRDLVWMRHAGLLGNGTVHDSDFGDNLSFMGGPNSYGNITVNFNCSVALANENLVNLIITLSNNTQGAYGAAGGGSGEISFNISGAIFLDGIAPNLTSAITNDTTSLNLSFSEAINFSSINVSYFNITIVNRTGHTEEVTSTPLDQSSTAANDGNGTILVMRLATHIEGNETPIVAVNISDLNTTYGMTDLAGNFFATNTTVTSTDGTGAFLKTSAINFTDSGMAVVTLFWSEPVVAPSTALDHGTFFICANQSSDLLGKGNCLNVTSVLVSSRDSSQGYDGNNITEFQLTAANSANVSHWKTLGWNATLNISAYVDDSSNRMSRPETAITNDGGNQVEFDHFGNDSVSPHLVSWLYNHETKQIIFTFSEYMDPTQIDVTGVTALNLTNINLSSAAGQWYSEWGDHDAIVNRTPLGGATILLNGTQDSTLVGGVEVALAGSNQTHFANTIAINLSVNAVDKLAVFDGTNGSTTLYIAGPETANITFKDAMGNMVLGLGHNISQKYHYTTDWTQDTTLPEITNIIITDANVTGPGIHTVVVTFSENLSNSSTLALTREGTAIHPFVNNSLLYGTGSWEMSYNFTTDDVNGVWKVNLTNASGITDLSGNALSGTNYTGLNFTYDSVAPYIVYAYYIENGTGDDSRYNGTQSVGDTFVLVFNEYLQAWSGNLSTGNFSFRDQGAMGNVEHQVNIYDNQIVISNSGERGSNLSLRGEWIKVLNATALQGTGSALNNRDLNVNNTHSWFVRDKADNFAIQAASDGEATVMADYAISVTNATPMTISVPTCLNTGNMSEYLHHKGSLYHSLISWYNTDTWTNLNNLSLAVPLAGYRFTWTQTDTNSLSSDANDSMLRIYLNNESDCDLRDLELSVDDGWNFLAINGNYYHNDTKQNSAGRMSDFPDNWLGSLSGDGTTNGIQVHSIIKDYGNATAYSNGAAFGGIDWDNLVVKPYEAWWVQSTAANTFTGVART